jgi:hypothetical protein
LKLVSNRPRRVVFSKAPWDGWTLDEICLDTNDPAELRSILEGYLCDFISRQIRVDEIECLCPGGGPEHRLVIKADRRRCIELECANEKRLGEAHHLRMEILQKIVVLIFRPEPKRETR